MMLPGTNSKSSPLVAPPCSNRAVPASEGGACRAAKAEKRAKKKAKAEAEAAEKKQSEDAGHTARATKRSINTEA